MKSIITSLLIIASAYISAQVSGNAVYALNGRVVPSNNIQVYHNENYRSYMKIKGLANVKADAYTVMFNVKQIGNTAEEALGSLDKRINDALSKIKRDENVECNVDMISFVPLYSLEENKRFFSKKTYTEIPSGFEVVKNIHITYTDSQSLDNIMMALAEQEIYDLIRVDYYSKELDAIKDSLKKEALKRLKEKINDFEGIVDLKIDSKTSINDAFDIRLPVEQYDNYTAYSRDYSSSNKFGRVTAATKKRTLYYLPVMDKEFDFVRNPVINEPVIQVMYEIDLGVYMDDESNNRYFVLGEEGRLTELNMK